MGCIQGNLEVEKDCNICFDEYNNNVTVIIPCEHRMCDSCALEMIKSNNQKCPFCRINVNMWHRSVRERPESEDEI